MGIPNTFLFLFELWTLRHEGGPKASYVAGLQLMRKMHESHVYGWKLIQNAGNSFAL